MKIPLREQIYAAFFAIIIAGLSQLTIPLGLIPLTGQTFAVGLAVTFLGMRTGTMSILIYLLLGLIGLPVFAGGASGIGVLFGPTGGYLIGFTFNGLLTETFGNRPRRICERDVSEYRWCISNIVFWYLMVKMEHRYVLDCCHQWRFCSLPSARCDQSHCCGLFRDFLAEKIAAVKKEKVANVDCFNQ